MFPCFEFLLMVLRLADNCYTDHSTALIYNAIFTHKSGGGWQNKSVHRTLNLDQLPPWALSRVTSTISHSLRRCKVSANAVVERRRPSSPKGQTRPRSLYWLDSLENKLRELDLSKIISTRPLIYTWVCRRESRPLVGKPPLVNVQPQIPVLHARAAGYFSQAVWWEKMASMSAKRTQFSFPLRCPFPAVSSKSFIATIYGLIYSSHLSANQGLYLALFPWC